MSRPQPLRIELSSHAIPPKRYDSAHMARSFECVDFKLAEADFFFEKMKSCMDSLWELNFYFSAFVSAARSVTFALQAVMNDQQGFSAWYSKKQDEMRADPVCRFFVTYRNEILKTGELFSTKSSKYFSRLLSNCEMK